MFALTRRPLRVGSVRHSQCAQFVPSWAIARTTDGEKLTQRTLDDAPTYDGMAVAGGRLYLSTQTGRLLCFGE